MDVDRGGGKGWDTTGRETIPSTSIGTSRGCIVIERRGRPKGWDEIHCRKK